MAAADNAGAGVNLTFLEALLEGVKGVDQALPTARELLSGVMATLEQLLHQTNNKALIEDELSVIKAQYDTAGEAYQEAPTDANLANMVNVAKEYAVCIILQLRIYT